MNDKSALTGAVLLETFWAVRKKDMLDLISPFVQYVVAKTTSVSENVNISLITEKVREDFGYEDIPESIIQKVLKRDSEHFERKKEKYFLKKDLDDISERFISKEHECRERIECIGNDLFNYLNNHCKKRAPKDRQQTIEYLQRFFKSFAIPVGLNSLVSEHISLRDDEIDYFIANYILDCKERKKKEYDYVMELTRGFFLKSAIYLQVDNADIVKARYRDTKVFFDTPILLRILKCDNDDKNKTAIELFKILKKQGAEFYYFPQNEKEVDSILTAYQYSLVNRTLTTSSRTLEGLDAKKYKFDDVARLRNTFARTLVSLGIHFHSLPDYYEQTLSGTVDVNKIQIYESDAQDYVKSHTKHYTDDNLESDVSSALGIHKLREGRISRSIEQCGAIFVTTNIDFTRAFNQFYRDCLGGDRVMPVITMFDLSAITWIKGGQVASDIPEQQLLINAYAALQPTPELFEKIREVLTKMVSEGSISEEEAILLRADRVTQKEFWEENTIAGYGNNVDEEYIRKLQKKHDELIVDATKNSLEKEYENAINKEKIERFNKARHDAQAYARNQRETYLHRTKILVLVVAAIVFCLCVAGTVLTFAWNKSTWIGIALICLALVDCFSTWDTIKKARGFIMKFFEKKANYREAQAYDKKFAELRKYIE